MSMEHGCPGQQTDGRVEGQLNILTDYFNNNIFMVICVIFHSDGTLTLL